MTTTLAKTKRVIGIENLNISGMMKNHCLAQAISDLGLFVNLEYIAVSSTEMKNSCGEASSGVVARLREKLALLKQERDRYLSMYHDSDFHRFFRTE